METPGRDGWHGTHGTRHRVVDVVVVVSAASPAGISRWEKMNRLSEDVSPSKGDSAYLRVPGLNPKNDFRRFSDLFH